ncbi:unnamed protein product [Strongylus vulgaris]|uniref:Uncharacterized protein n=1 Tax=Strongylus vulgaris TaxID=40348 RepID=A0A3P7IXC3_STRVU|nr:unnamed protein product [Strongylus vulgaris]
MLSYVSGFCLPITCHVDAVKSLANRFSDEFLGFSEKSEILLSIEDTNCHGRNERWEHSKRFLIIATTTIILLLLLATVVDIYVVNKESGTAAEIEDNECTFSGSDLNMPFDTLEKVNCFNAPSLVLTYKPVPDLSRSLAKPAIFLDIRTYFPKAALSEYCKGYTLLEWSQGYQYVMGNTRSFITVHSAIHGQSQHISP